MTVVVVDDSAVQRRFLRGAIDAAPEFDVVGEARNGKEAVALVERLRPHAVVMDLDLPVMGGVEAIERIMASCATPILVYSAFVAGEDSENALEALSAGAVDVLAKPGPQDTGTLDEYAETLRTRLRMVSRIRVITHPRGRLRSGAQLTGEAKTLVAGTGRRPLASTPVFDEFPARDGVKLLVIGASTGGPHALLSVLSALPAELPQAVLVVQHMAEGFIGGLASWLDQLVPLPVSVGESGRRLEPGTVTIAPSGGNLLVQDNRLRVLVTPPEPGQFHVPGIDATMNSIADALGPDAVGVLLTGMGRDGAAGLLAMRKRGAYTIGQDESTSAVYGMPAAAAALDAIDRQLAIDDIGPALREILRTTSKTAG
ncbi:MAG: two-component system, chemotaxis family, protein-glutamate methylesterase/glutaminase [Actinomycetota bacterium]|jgi:two-component system chemotaxis response regulator CheB|nr:two-component system, chemotaxis family, protein-glutamate methylesterase/glutaminase [Actinomycetota bacterium]